jgi:tetratricopeptide (TPR) repeat protein
MRALVLAVSILFLLPVLADAQPAKTKQAEQHFHRGQKHFAAGEFDDAVREFLQAYTLVPVNPLLFNIGQAYRRSGDAEKALSYYEKYVAFEPGGGQVAEAKEHITALKIQVEDARRERAQADEERRAREEEERRVREEAERAHAEAELARRRAEVDKVGGGKRTAGLVLGGLGLAGLGVGVALAATDGLDAKSAAIGGAGAAALITGGVLYYLGVKERRDARAALGPTSALVPQLGPGSFGLAWLTTF